MPLRNNNFSSAMQIVLVFALTVLLILLSVFNAVSSTTTVSLTNTNHLHNRRSLHQPFFPSTIVADPVHPPSPSPQPQPTRPLYKHPTTTTTTSSDPTTTTASPFFPVYQAPPPPSPPPPPPPSPSSDNNYAALPTFPANISSLVVPNSHHSSPSSSHSPPSLKLIIISVILCLLAVVLLISLALLHRRHRHRYRDGPFKPTNEIDSPPSDDVRLYPSDSASSDIHPLPPNPKPFRPNTSAEFLYLGTIASTHSREFEHTNVDTHLESPEIRPLPPLPRKGHHLSGHQANPYPDTDTSGGEEGNQRVVRHYQSNDDEEDAVESFYSPVGSPDRLRRLSSTSSRRAIEVLERDIYLENQNCSSYSPISTSSSLSNSKQWEPSSIPVNLNSHTSNPSSPGGMSTPSPMEVRLPTLRHPINHSREFGGNGKESGLSKLFKEEIERPATTTDTDYSKAKEQVLPPQPPPPPPPPVFVRTESKPGPPPLPRPWRSFSSGEQERVRSGEVSKPKLKPLHWDNFWTSSDRAMVWDQLKSGSFQFNEELIEKLFGVNGPTAKRLNMYSSDQEYRVLDPKKSQNLSIILRASNVNVEMVYDVLVEGNTEILGSELLECLLRIKPTKEEESKLKECRDDSPAMLDPAEKFLKAIINIPFAYKRMEAMLYVAKFDSETEYLRKSFDTLEIACEELKNSRMFLKLLEAVLNTGNRMNNGTIRGDARAFKLDTLLKLVYIKGTDGKTTLLHFVVYEIIKSEGCRFSEPDNEDSRRTSLQDDIDTRKRGLEIIAGLGSELTNVKKAAAIDYKTLGIDVGRLANGLVGVEEVVKLSEQLEADNGLNNGKTARSMRFRDSMSGFLKKAREEIRMIGAKERCSLVKVKEVTEYFHGNSVEEESHPLRIFVVVRDFLLILDKVCKEVGKLNERKVVSASHTVPMPVAVAASGE